MPIVTDGPMLAPERGIHELSASFGQSIGATAGEAWSDSPLSQLMTGGEIERAKGETGPATSFDPLGQPYATDVNGVAVTEDVKPAVPRMDMIEALDRVKKAGLEKHLTLPNQPDIPPAQLEIMMRTAQARREREATIERGPQGFIPSALQVGTSFLVGAADPINVASAFIPIMGELRYGKLLASAGESAGGRFAVRAGVGAAQGAVGQAALEPLDWWAHTQEGRDFGMSDVLRNIMFGAALGGGLHAGGGFISDAYRGAKGRPLYPFGPGEPLARVPGVGTHVPGVALGEDGITPEQLEAHFRRDEPPHASNAQPAGIEASSEMDDLVAQVERGVRADGSPLTQDDLFAAERERRRKSHPDEDQYTEEGNLLHALKTVTNVGYSQEQVDKAINWASRNGRRDIVEALEARERNFESLLADATERAASRSPEVATINDLPPRAHEDAMRVAISDLINGDAVRSGDVLSAAAQTDPRIAESFDAWHGSPHDFERFDVSKIGTGEGAQAFGRGIYLAEAEATALSYKSSTSGQIRFPGMTPEDERVINGTQLLMLKGLSPVELKAKAAELAEQYKTSAEWDRQSAAQSPNYRSRAAEYDAIAEAMHKLAAAPVEDISNNAGNIYRVRVTADHDRLLDWDKPLSEQSAFVREKLAQAFPDEPYHLEWTYRSLDSGSKWLLHERGERLGPFSGGLATVEPKGADGFRVQSDGLDRIVSSIEEAQALAEQKIGQLKKTFSQHDPSGEDVWHRLNSLYGSEDAATKLAEAGIPGIKYLDAGSRTEGEGTRNFVVFNDKDIEITHKNGDPVKREEFLAEREAARSQPRRQATRPPPTAPDPLDLAMAGELTAERARQIAEDLTRQQRAVEDDIFKGRAEEWRKLTKRSDRAWDNARDDEARALDRQIEQLEHEVGLTQADEDWLDGKGWDENSVAENWEDIARSLQDIENGREDAIAAAAAAVRYIPKSNDWSRMSNRERESVITLLTAMNEERKAGRDSKEFLRETFAERVRRYGGGADAHEVVEHQMQELADLLSKPLERDQGGAMPSAPAVEQRALPAPKQPRGRAAADPQTWSLFEFLAHEGGLRPDPELNAIFGSTKSPFVPGFGALVRKNGRTLDDALRLAKDHGYMFDAADVTGGEGKVAINDLLDRLAEERAGRRQYRSDQQFATKAEVAADLEREKHDILRALHDEIEATTGQQGVHVDPELEDRVVQIIQREGEQDVLAAYERAIMEDAERYEGLSRERASHAETANIPGWDAPESGAASRAGEPGAGERGQAGLPDQGAGRADGGQSRAAGAGNRAPAQTQLDKAAAWRGISQVTSDFDAPDIVAASNAAAKVEPPKTKLDDRVTAAEKAEAYAKALYDMFAHRLPDDERARLEETIASLDQMKADRDVVTQRGAACLFEGSQG